MFYGQCLSSHCVQHTLCATMSSCHHLQMNRAGSQA
jgi:hypothetical protein